MKKMQDSAPSYIDHVGDVKEMIAMDIRDIKAKISGQSILKEHKIEIVKSAINELIDLLNKL